MNRERQSDVTAASVVGTTYPQRCSDNSGESAETRWCYTQPEGRYYTPEVIHVSYTWTICNICNRLQMQQLEPIKSPLFSTFVNGNESRWFLKLYLNENVEDGDHWPTHREDRVDNWGSWREDSHHYHRLSGGREFEEDDYINWSSLQENVLLPRRARELCENCYSYSRIANSEYLSLYLFLESSDEEKVFAKFTLSVLNVKLQKIISMSRREQFQRNSGMNYNGFPNFLSKDFLFAQKNHLLKNDTLIVKCEIAICTEETFNIHRQLREVRSIDDFKFTNQMKSLLNRKEMSDITLIASGQKFLAHKAILAARSPVFAEMFKHKMNNKVMIMDIDPEVLKEVLVFIYTDKSPNLKSMAADLLPIADKYNIGLGSLKKMCEKIMYRTIHCA